MAGLDKFDGATARHPVLLLVDDVQFLAFCIGQIIVIDCLAGILLKSLDVDDHYLHFIAHGKLTHAAQVF